MGAVLSVCIFPPVIAEAATFTSNKFIKIPPNTNGSFFTEIEQVAYLSDNSKAGLPVELTFNNMYINIPTAFTYPVRITTYTPSGTTMTSNADFSYNLSIASVKLHLIVNGKEYIIDPFRYDYVDFSYNNPDSDIKEYYTYRMSQPEIKDIKIYTEYSGKGRVSVLSYYEIILGQDLNVSKDLFQKPSYPPSYVYLDNYVLPVYVERSFTYVDNKSGISSVDYDNATIDSIERNTEQLQEYHEIDRSDAEQAGSDMTGFASQLDNLKNTWSILWYPIEFTNRFIQVFVGGTSAVAYQDEFAYITGYTYNDETGFLEPIMARSVQPASAGTGITFPAFSLMGFQIWDSYTYDLSQVKDQLPVVFDALYVIISILEMLWFVGYLRKKYEEVFG